MTLIQTQTKLYHMKTQQKVLTWIAAFVMIGLAGLNILKAQTNYQNTSGKVVVKGTSTLHDWEMASEKGQTKATFTINGDQLTGITALQFSVLAESLKSDKSGLDKNAYKALNTDKHKNITFILTNGSVTSAGGNKYKISAIGNLTINGKAKKVTLNADGILQSDNSLTVSGTTKFKMSEFDVKAPVLMMGSIKTGDEVTIEYTVKLKP